MNPDIKTLKAELFDIIEKQSVLMSEHNQLDQQKNQKYQALKQAQMKEKEAATK